MIARVFTHSAGIHHICATPAGLWIAHQGGLTFFDPESGRTAKWTTADGIPALPVLHVAADGARIAVATPNGLAWHDVAAILESARAGARGPRWHQALAHPRGNGAYLNGIGFVAGRLHAATGGGRLYREGERGFELVQLPLPQARLLRVLPLPAPPRQLRLLLISNNSGVLLLATGGGEDPSLYQWSEQEGLSSRYVTAVTVAGDFVAVGVHGGVHVARTQDLVERPGAVSRWGRVTLGEISSPVEQGRVHSVMVHAEQLYIGSAAGLHRLPLSALAAALQADVNAELVEDSPVRQLASHAGELWCVQYEGLCRLSESSVAATPAVESAPAWRFGLQRSRRAAEPAAYVPRITSFTKHWRLVPEPRWRVVADEPESMRIGCLASSPPRLLCGGDWGRVLTWTGQRWSWEGVVRRRRSPEVHAVAPDPESGRVWCATRHGLYGRDSRGRWARDLDFPGRTVHQLVVWEGRVLALGSAGLHVRSQGAWNAVNVAGDATAFYTAALGPAALVLGARPGAGFYRWKRSTPRPERWALPVGRANCLAWDGPERLWIGTDRGLLCWHDERLETYSWDAGAEDHVTAVLVHDGTIVVGSHAGIWIADAAALQAGEGALESRGQRLGLLDGLPHAQVTALVVHDEQIWVGTQGGLATLA